MTILCVTPNPNIEKTWIVSDLRLGNVNRAEDATLLPSGKGVNAARAIRNLGGKAFCTGILGGYTGKQIAHLVKDMNIDAEWIWIEQESRISLVICDSISAGKDTTLISELGPNITSSDWSNLSQIILNSHEEFQLGCLSGSLPKGLSCEDFRQLIQDIETHGIPLWIDCNGRELEFAVQAQPTGLKINQLEAASLLGRRISGIRATARAAEEIRKNGVKKVILTLGKKGAVLATPEGTWHGYGPPLPVISSVGSGDAFLGGWLNGIACGHDQIQSLKEAIAAGAANTQMLGACKFEYKDFLDYRARTKIRRITL